MIEKKTKIQIENRYIERVDGKQIKRKKKKKKIG